MNIRAGAGPMGVDIGRRLLATVRWLVESMILLFVGAARFLFASWRGLIVGVVVVAILVLLDEIPGPKGTPAINAWPVPVLNAITVFEVFIIAACWRLASGFRNRARRAGWTRFLSTWAAGGLVFALVALGVSRLASMGWYPAGGAEMIPAPAVVLGLLAAAAVGNRAALGKTLATEHSRSADRLIRGRILAAVAKRPLLLPDGAAYSSWYAWAACGLAGSPAIAHHAAEAAVSSLMSGADAATAAGAARRSKWTPAGVVEQIRSKARATEA